MLSEKPGHYASQSRVSYANPALLSSVSFRLWAKVPEPELDFKQERFGSIVPALEILTR